MYLALDAHRTEMNRLNEQKHFEHKSFTGKCD